MSGGSRETVLNELMVMPWAFRSASRQVITVTPVAKEEKPLRSSCGVYGVMSSCLLNDLLCRRCRRSSRDGCSWNWD